MAMNPTNLISGDVASIIQIHHGRGKGSADRPICACRATSLPGTGPSQGDPESLAIMDKATRFKEKPYLALGLRPGVPMIVPRSQLASLGLPEPLVEVDNNVYEDMTKEAFNNFKGTFLRKTLHISDVQFHSYGGDAGFFVPINPQGTFEVLPSSLKMYPGWSVVTFDTPEQGFDYSGWMFLIDGNLVYTFIKHEDINGVSKKLFKPQDIYEQIIEPRINKGIPITKYGLTLKPDGNDGFEILFVETGKIYKSTYIDVSQYMIAVDPIWTLASSWEDAFDEGNPVYENWPLTFTECGFEEELQLPFCCKLYPTSGYVLPVMTLILAKWLITSETSQLLNQFLGIYGNNFLMKSPIGWSDLFAWIENLGTMLDIIQKA